MTPAPVPVLFTIPNFITAGSGAALLNVVERLDRERFAPSICVLRRGGPLEAEIERLGIPLLEAPFTISAKPYASLLMRAHRAAGHFRGRGFRIWHSYHYAGEYVEPLVARLSGAQHWLYTKKNMNWHQRSWYVRTLLASRVAAQNTDMLTQFFSSRLFARKARLVPRGVDVAQFDPERVAPAPLRAALGLGSDACLVVSVANLLPVKGHPTLIEALARSCPDLHLVVAGSVVDTEYAEGLRSQVQRLGLAERVHFLGPRNDVAAVLAAADIFVLATWERWRMEGCPVALLEAMAAGRPCVATSIPGARDIIEDGRNGRLVPPEDAAALGAAIADLAQSPSLRQQLGDAARRTVVDSYSIDTEVHRHEALYEELLA